MPGLHDPEAVESADEFRLLRCCGREMIAPSSSLHDPKARPATAPAGMRVVVQFKMKEAAN
jgi:hypothetical protein